MIKRFGIQNFKVFKEYQEFDLAPITILTGTNSSGKSCMRKSLELLNFKGNTLKDISKLDLPPLNYLQNNNLTNWDSESKDITITLNVFWEKVRDCEVVLNYTPTKHAYILDNLAIYWNVEGQKRGLIQIKAGVLGEGHYAKMNFEFSTLHEMLEANLKEYLKAEKKNPGIFALDQHYGGSKLKIARLGELFDQSLFQYIFQFEEESFLDYVEILRSEGYDSQDENWNDYLLELVENYYRLNKIWKEDPNFKKNLQKAEFEVMNGVYKKLMRTDSFIPSNGDFTYLFDMILNNEIEFDDIERHLSNFPVLNALLEKNVNNISNRAEFIWSKNINNTLSETISKEIIRDNEFYNFYNISGAAFANCHVNLLENFPTSKFSLFYQNFILEGFNDVIRQISRQVSGIRLVTMERLLSDRHLNLDSSFSYILLNSIIENESLSSKLRYWLNEFNIAEDFVVTEDDEIIRLYLIKNGSRINIKDLGYGCSQLVPLLIYVIGVDNSYQGNVKIIVEEPEVNLHPSLQSKLADFLVEIAMLKKRHLMGVEFIVETHSEYLIRKLQYLVATKKLNEDEAVIYYFNDTAQQMKSAEKVFKININKDGSLTRNFGPGFFDEADNIALDLFNLQNNSN